MRLVVLDTEKCVGCQCCMFACARRSGDAGLATSSIMIRSMGGMERGFKVIVCRACDEPPCAAVCPVGALAVQSQGGVRLDEKKCIGCGFCAKACIVNAVMWNEDDNKPMICVHCGYCVHYCPHTVLGMEQKEVLHAQQ
jgi:carbon-monoxide dehydrogenase iron sulfur subunit